MRQLFTALLGLGLLAQSAFGAPKIATLVLLDPVVQVIRSGKVIDIHKQETELFAADRIETGPEGKAKLAFENGDVVYLGPNSALDLSAEQGKEAMKIDLNLTGKLRALVNRRPDRSFQVRTVNAVVGVKGTDFVVEEAGSQTRVATFNGLVALASAKSGQSVDVPPGKQGSISPSGEVMPLTEIAGDILSGVEIAGKKLSIEEAAGSKVSP